MKPPVSLHFPSTSIQAGVSTIFRTPYDEVAIDAGAFPDLSEARKLSAILLTHGHWDHAAQAAKLLGEKKVPVFCTPPTRKILAFNGRMYTGPKREEGRGIQVAREVTPVGYFEPFEIGNGLIATFLPAGHIPGSAEIVLEYEGVSCLFSGDINTVSFGDARGRPFSGEALYENPERGKKDALVLECTHAERDGISGEEAYDCLRRAMLEVAERGERAIITAPNLMRGAQAAYLVRQVLAEDPGAFRDYSLCFPGGRGLAFTKRFYRDTYDELVDGGLVTKAGEKGHFPGKCFLVTQDVENFLGRKLPWAMITTKSALPHINEYAAEGISRVYYAPIPVHAGGEDLAEYAAGWMLGPGGQHGEIFLNHGRPPSYAAMKARLIGKGFDSEKIHIPVER